MITQIRLGWCFCSEFSHSALGCLLWGGTGGVVSTGSDLPQPTRLETLGQLRHDQTLGLAGGTTEGAQHDWRHWCLEAEA